MRIRPQMAVPVNIRVVLVQRGRVIMAESFLRLAWPGGESLLRLVTVSMQNSRPMGYACLAVPCARFGISAFVLGMAYFAVLSGQWHLEHVLQSNVTEILNG